MRLLSLICLIFTLLSTPLQAEVSKENIETFIRLSNMDSFIETWPDSLKSQVNNDIMASSNPERYAEIINKLLPQYDVAQMKKALREYISSHSTNTFIEELIKLYKTPGYTEVEHVLDSEMLSPDFQQKLMMYLSSMEKNPPDQERVSLTMELVVNGNGAEMILRALQSIMQAVGNEREIKKQAESFERMRPQIVEKLNEQFTITMLAASQDIPLKAYRKYVSLATSEIGLMNIEFQTKIFEKVIWKFDKRVIAFIKEESGK